ncbi:MAG: hypothetical protein JWO36_557 [Myxococcales bacterium]|nr:hypothetical protein [Myxococcales bacterium]
MLPLHMRRWFVLVAMLGARVAHAQDPFEIQVYDAETAARGEPGIEIHLNQHRIDAAPDQTHMTFEPHYGLTSWAELGGYLQTSLDTTGDLAYAGVKLRLKLRWPRRLANDRIGLAINGELATIPARFEINRWGSEVRPIIDLAIGRLYVAANPIIAIDLRGDVAGHPLIEPALKVAIHATDAVSLGVETYGAFGPIDDLGSEHVTSALAVLDVIGSWWDLDLGAGYSWSTPDHTMIKLIVGIHPRRRELK